MKRPYLAHSRNDRGRGVPEEMPQHVLPVRDRAEAAGGEIGMAVEAAIGGAMHDLGKYSDRFLDRLDGKLPGLDHSSAGARAVLEYAGGLGRPIALVIEGHHVGIPRGSGCVGDHTSRLDQQLLSDASTGSDWRSMVRRAHADGIMLPCREEFVTAVSWSPGSGSNDAAEMLDVRMLFATLVDADFIETEAHFSGDALQPRRYRPSGPLLDPRPALAEVLRETGEQSRNSKATPAILKAREAVLEACLTAASDPIGLFTLTAPTGSGKTLAMLAFALAHAARHREIRRLILVIPYLAIIDQTAKICRRLFGGLGPHVVLEDHSAVRRREDDLDNEDVLVRQQRLLAENWDAPIVLTTSLNALESLHANGPRRCRKLHHLANSVLLFDEVQTLPPHLAELTLATFSRLSHRFKTTIVFSTATQPAFDALDCEGKVARLCDNGWRPQEIVPSAPRLFELTSDRYCVTWRLDEPVRWEALASELREQSSSGPAIAVVNLKRHAVSLVEAMQVAAPDQPLFHLSTNLCLRHREQVLSRLAPLLESGTPMVLVATQCIECGIDISAPAVYRALAPLESVAQAAGRCNRHGTDPQPGRVVVFVPEEEAYPPGAYEMAAKHTKSFITELRTVDGIDLDRHNVLSDPSLLRRYYRQLYQAGIHESHKRGELLRATEERDFPEVARLYRLIDQDTINVLVPYDREAFRSLVRQIEKTGKITREWVAEARPLAIGVRRPQPGDEAAAAVRPMPPGIDDFEADWFVLQEGAAGELYDPQLFGLKELKASWFV